MLWAWQALMTAFFEFAPISHLYGEVRIDLSRFFNRG